MSGYDAPSTMVGLDDVMDRWTATLRERLKAVEEKLDDHIAEGKASQALRAVQEAGEYVLAHEKLDLVNRRLGLLARQDVALSEQIGRIEEKLDWALKLLYAPEFGKLDLKLAYSRHKAGQ